MSYENLVVETRGRVGLVTLNRPKALNALNAALIDELLAALDAFEADDGIGATVITGSERVFAAGADIKEMVALSFVEAFTTEHAAPIGRVGRMRKPLIAAVAGYCLGGGCELAMMCDIVIAADTAKFGQPETTLGIIPGMGGTQRLPRLIGKARAMDMVLTGRTIDAAEALRSGLVSRVVSPGTLLDEAMKVAETIASYSLPSVLMAKESVNRAFETPLAEGLRFEQRLFHALFATEDQKEGMAAFVDKRPPRFKHR